MRRSCFMLFVPMVLVAQEVPVLPLAEAEATYLQALDEREGAGPVPLPAVAPPDQAALRWLSAAAEQDLPANPFPAGGAAWREAEGVRRLLRAAPHEWGKSLKTLPVTLGGSYLALWRWGQGKVREGRMGKALRILWEDRLLAEGGPGMVRSSALRHALCFALAEADLERFGRLKEWQEDAWSDFFTRFQNAFSLLGSPAPVVRLWSLPRMEPADVSLAELGGLQVRLEPDPGAALPDLPPGTAWIVPTRDGVQPEESSYLEGVSLEEARSLAARLEAAGRTAYLAPTRSVLEAYALMFFPARIVLDRQGRIKSIRMGDAALAVR